ncbi:MAG: trypsin-like peptidase domain-containing protein [Acidobacteria bacterium]|nr:trypsin-like peptidase domain-containing protein [Acidobacteriota bacterium]
MLVSLSGKEKGKTYIFDKETVRIGTDKGCDLLIPKGESSEDLDNFIAAEILCKSSGFQLTWHNNEKCSISINDNSISQLPSDNNNLELQDGDLLGFRHKSKESRYSMHVVEDKSIIPQPKKQLPKPEEHLFPEVDVVGHIHPLTATRFLKGLVSGLWAEIPSSFKVFCLLMTILVLGGGVFSLSYVLKTLNDQSTDISKLVEEKERNLATIKVLEEKNRKLIESWEKDRIKYNLAQTINETYQNGVCLIQGVYTYINPQTGAQLRYLDNAFNNRPLLDENGQQNVSFDGTGALFYESFSGTGFLIGEGEVLTNRHVVHPWWRDETDRIIIAQGGKPQLVELYAFFPGIKPRFELSVKAFSKENDVAISTFEQGDAAIPKLPLNPVNEAAAIGQPMVLIGYPTGVDGLIERLDDKVKNEINRKAFSPEERIKEVAERGLIHPLISQGHINGLNAGRIIHDAATTEGGSGSPIFNSEGEVIGINSSIITTDRGVPVQGSNLGIPIRFALELKKDSKN